MTQDLSRQSDPDHDDHAACQPASRHLLQALFSGAARYPTREVFSWRDADGVPTAGRDFETLLARSSAVAQALRAASVGPGERALMIFEPSLEFIDAFLGCLRAGVIPVPIYPPNPHSESDIRRLIAVLLDAQAKTILTHDSLVQQASESKRFRQMQESGFVLPWIVTDTLELDSEETPEHAPRPSDTAFIQYTSGSTLKPKGVLISHENLNHQLRISEECLGVGRDTRAVSWVPPYHDLGLISCICSALFSHSRMALISPASFLNRPGLWFDVVSEFRATHTCAPNFGYEYLLRRTTTDQRAHWDLSSLRVMMSAAERIRPTTVRKTLEALVPLGLDPAAFCGAYGLAEHTVAVTLWGQASRSFDRAAMYRDGAAVAPEAGQPSTEIMSCGRPAQDVRLEIVDPATNERVADGHIGEIWVDSASKARGYHGMADAQPDFGARIEGEDRTYLRTGDMGFVLDGELFVSHRLKDVLIVRGHNVAPEDVEDACQSVHPQIRAGRVVALPIDTADGEHFAVLAEVTDPGDGGSKLKDLATELGRAVASVTTFKPASVLLLAPRTLKKTTSGKPRRRACKAELESGSWESRILYRWTDEASSDEPGDQALVIDDVYRLVRQEISSITGVSPSSIPLNGPIRELGVDSLGAITLVERLSAVFGVSIPATMMLRHQSLEQLCVELFEHVSTPRERAPEIAETGLELDAGDRERRPTPPRDLAPLEEELGRAIDRLILSERERHSELDSNVHLILSRLDDLAPEALQGYFEQTAAILSAKAIFPAGSEWGAPAFVQEIVFDRGPNTMLLASWAGQELLGVTVFGVQLCSAEGEPFLVVQHGTYNRHRNPAAALISGFSDRFIERLVAVEPFGLDVCFICPTNSPSVYCMWRRYNERVGGEMWPRLTSGAPSSYIESALSSFTSQTKLTYWGKDPVYVSGPAPINGYSEFSPADGSMRAWYDEYRALLPEALARQGAGIIIARRFPFRNRGNH